MKIRFHIAIIILFLFNILFFSQALGAEEELIVNFNPAGDSRPVVQSDEFTAEFTFSGTIDKLVKTIEFGALLSAYYDEDFGGQKADFVTRVTINGKSIVWSGVPFYNAPTSPPEPDLHTSDPKTVFDEIEENIIISQGDTIYLKIGIGSAGGQGIIYNDNESNNNYLKLIIDEAPATCNVSAAFALNNDSEKKLAAVGETVTFTNKSTGDGVDSATWEWSFQYPPNMNFPETLKNIKSPSITFDTLGSYAINLKASLPGDLCSTDKSIALEVIDTNLSHAVKGLKVLTGIDDILSSTDIKLTDLVKDGKIKLEDIISILKKIAEQ